MLTPSLNWLDPQYLRRGTPRQQQAYTVLHDLGIWSVLSAFDPLLAGTIPLGIDTADSDLDVICAVEPTARQQFKQLLQRHYGHLPEFCFTQMVIGGRLSSVCSFRSQGVVVEVFGQALPTFRQHAYRHLVVEYAVLQAGGEAWRAAVQRLKQQGLKTEPAFAALLHLPGDPYEALLTLENKTPFEVAAYLAEHPLPAV